MVNHRRMVIGNIQTVPVVSGFNYSWKPNNYVEIFCNDDKTYTDVVKSEADLTNYITANNLTVVTVPNSYVVTSGNSSQGVQSPECPDCNTTFKSSTPSAPNTT